MADNGGGGGVPAHLKVSYEDRHDGITVVRVERDGRVVLLDDGSAYKLHSELIQIAGSGRYILVLDLSAVSEIGGVHLRVLVDCLRPVHIQGGAISLVVSSSEVRKALTDVRLDTVFRIHADVPDAVAALAATYADQSIEQRRAIRAERANRSFTPGGLAYEHVSESITVVRLPGEVDVYTAPVLREALVYLVNHGRFFLVLDMSAVEYFESTGLGVMVGGLKRVRAHEGALAVVAPYGRIRKTFRTTGLSKVFPLFGTVGAAVEFLGREAGAAHG